MIVPWQESENPFERGSLDFETWKRIQVLPAGRWFSFNGRLKGDTKCRHALFKQLGYDTQDQLEANFGQKKVLAGSYVDCETKYGPFWRNLTSFARGFELASAGLGDFGECADRPGVKLRWLRRRSPPDTKDGPTPTNIGKSLKETRKATEVRSTLRQANDHADAVPATRSYVASAVSAAVEVEKAEKAVREADSAVATGRMARRAESARNSSASSSSALHSHGTRSSPAGKRHPPGVTPFLAAAAQVRNGYGSPTDQVVAIHRGINSVLDGMSPKERAFFNELSPLHTGCSKTPHVMTDKETQHVLDTEATAMVARLRHDHARKEEDTGRDGAGALASNVGTLNVLDCDSMIDRAKEECPRLFAILTQRW